MKGKLFSKDRSSKREEGVAFLTERPGGHPFVALDSYIPLSTPQHKLYDAMREAIPILDAAVDKIVRLIGTFRMTTGEGTVDRALEHFLRSVPSGGAGRGIDSFVAGYLDSLLCYGNAVGEMVLTPEQDGIAAVRSASLDGIEIGRAPDGIGGEVLLRRGGKRLRPPHPELVFYSTLGAAPGDVVGRSIFKGLPFVGGILLKIWDATAKNFERVGNVRFAVTYKPAADGSDRGLIKERTERIATAWSSAMSDSRVRDFICAGDVDIKVIGADNQIPDIQIPVRQMLEQIVAKLGIPPFLLGLSWSSTERMSAQQADILTSELESYRRLLEPVLLRIARTQLRLCGCPLEPKIEWNVINLQDEVEMSKARLQRAQSLQIERELGEESLDPGYLRGDFA